MPELVGRAGSYAALRFAADTADPAHGALLQHVQERATAIQTTLLFFELEWAGARRRARRGAARRPTALDFCRHHLRTRAPLPPAPADRARGEDPRREGAHRPQRLGAAVRRADRPRSRSTLRGRGASRSRSRSGARAALRPRPRRAPHAPPRRVTAALAPGLRTRAFIFNTLLHDKAVDDRLRRYPHWLARAQPLQRGERRVGAGAGRAPCAPATTLPRRWYRLKAQLLGLERLADYDRMARRRAGGRARRLGRGARRSCSTPTTTSRPSSATLARRFFDERWIDAPVRPGKRGGAFCAYTVPSAHPYVLLNYTGPPPRRADARPRARPRRARRAGGAAGRLPPGHAADARRDGVACSARRSCSAACSTRPRRRSRASRCSSEAIEGAIATVFRQIGDEPLRGPRPHRAPRARASCRSSASASCGRGRRRSCSATPSRSPRATARGGPTSPTSSTRPATSTRTPTGSCSRCPSTRRYEEEGAAFVPDYLELLAAGGSRRPRSSAGSSASTSPTRASGTRASRSSSEQLDAAEQAARDAGRA